MECASPPRHSQAAFYVVVSGICLEVLCTVSAFAGLVLGLGFPNLRAAAALGLTGAVVGLAAAGCYPCCCAVRGQGAYVGFAALACAFSLAALIAAAAVNDETPCVRHDCYQEMFGECAKCSGGKRGCEPSLAYECSHGSDFRSELLTWRFCDGVRYCSNWDEDCSKSGSSDDGWFWGFANVKDCEDMYGVAGSRLWSRVATILAAIVGLAFRGVAIAALAASPEPSAFEMQLARPEVLGIELAPVVSHVVVAEPHGGGAYPDPHGAMPRAVPVHPDSKLPVYIK
mmetsp:Transcript_23220/g.80520  ORF Transcript_23220/g.80520 Transcript_23220/m.80520 type:complete len:285 (+) Transcript_23220:37-891(+)